MPKKAKTRGSAERVTGAELSRRVEFDHLRFLSISARSSLPLTVPSAEPHELTPLYRVECSAKASPKGRRLLVEIDWCFGLTDAPDQDPIPVKVEIGLKLELAYSLTEDTKTPKEALLEFARVNGLFHAWPFIRAEVHSLLPKLGLPPFLLPVQRIGPDSLRPAGEKAGPAPRKLRRSGP